MRAGTSTAQAQARADRQDGREGHTAISQSVHTSIQINCTALQAGESARTYVACLGQGTLQLYSCPLQPHACMHACMRGTRGGQERRRYAASVKLSMYVYVCPRSVCVCTLTLQAHTHVLSSVSSTVMSLTTPASSIVSLVPRRGH